MSDKDMARLIAVLEKALGKDWRAAIEWIRERNSITDIEQRIVRGDLAGLIADIEQAARKFASSMHTAYVTAGDKEANWLDPKVPDALVRFDQTNDRAVERARRNEYRTVAEVSDEQRAVIRRVVIDGATTGRNPRETARELRDSIGLTDYQQRHVANYRRALETGDFGNALGRELRDARSDRMLRRLAGDDGRLTPAQVDKLVERYRLNYVAHRAEVIARTEALRAANEGSAELYRQAIERGDVEAEELSKEWNSGPRTRYARPDHQAMDGATVRVDEDFVLPDGTRMAHPGDPRGGAEHTAQCRCTVGTRYRRIPAGFSTEGLSGGSRRIEDGVPHREEVDDNALYRLSPDEIRRRLRALPGGGDDKTRLQRIRDGWARGVKLPPVDLAITASGDLVVGDGRHRLLVALEEGREVLARISTAATGAESGTVRLLR